MPREIKFRVWCEKEKAFMFRVRLDEEGQHFDRDMAMVYKPMIWQQFTGLLDKNGKEIYEGDIVKSRGPFENEMKWQKRIVKFKNDGCCAGFSFRDEGQLGCDVGYPDGREVIGNIYEKKKLLK